MYLLPAIAMQERPHGRVPEPRTFAWPGFAHFDPQVPFRVRPDHANRAPVARRGAGAIARLELRLLHAPGAVTRSAQALRRRRMPRREAILHAARVVGLQAARQG